METYDGYNGVELVFHFIIYFPNSCILAFFIYLLCLADRLSCSQTFQTYEEVWILTEGFFYKQIQEKHRLLSKMIDNLYTIFFINL